MTAGAKLGLDVIDFAATEIVVFQTDTCFRNSIMSLLLFIFFLFECLCLTSYN